MKTTIEMAREAGMTFLANVEELRSPFSDGVWLEDIEHFEALVRADEREQALAAPVQEPVAHINQNGVIHEAGYEWGPTNELTALYATPPAQEFVCSTGLCHYKAQRQWVGLTEDERDTILRSENSIFDMTEAILKAKNT